MTCSHDHHVGYRGQRYEVRYKNHDGLEHVFGWLDNADGEPFVSAIKLWPNAVSYTIVDLGESLKVRMTTL